MKKLIALLLFPNLAFAGTATITWTPPTENTDGTAYTDPGGFKIYYGNTGQPLTTVVDIPDTTNTINTRVIDNLAPGDWSFAMTAYNSSGGESTQTNPISKTIIPDTTPLPPDPTFVTVDTAAYNVVKRDDGFVLVYVGMVPLNTPCDKTQTVNGKYVVPASTVTWAGTVEPIVVVATCSTN